MGLGGNSKTYFKRNYVKVLETLTPEFYINEDIEASSTILDPIDELINSHVVAASNFNQLLTVSNSPTHSLTGVSGISPYFIKQYNLGNIKSINFENKILFPVGRSYTSFSTSEAFMDYVSGSLLPIINTSGIYAGEASAFGTTITAAHDYLLENLGWLYILNTSSANNTGPITPSSLLTEPIAKILYSGRDMDIADCLKIFEEYIWRNYFVFSSIDEKLLPSYLVSGNTSSTYTSGTQNLDRLKTLIEVVHEDDNFNYQDTYVEDAFSNFDSLGTLLDNRISAGPFYKFLQGIAYSIADRQSEIEDIGNLLDIENCPEQFLPYIAELIGWRLLGHDPDRWRLQLRSAALIYRAKGTKKAIQLITNTIFGTDNFTVSSSDILVELYESYIPNLIYYVLATDSVAFANNAKLWTEEVAISMGVMEYSDKGIDENLRLAVDYIILDLVKTFPYLFFLGNKLFDIEDPNFIFNYRGRDFPIPPWEEERYYQNCGISINLLNYLKERLRCFGVTEEVAESTRLYVSGNTIGTGIVYSTDNQWVFFTSAIQYPLNYNDVLSNPTEKRSEYLGLWNSRSSHFSMLFNASSFSFSKKKSIDPDSALALREVVAGVDQVVPAHSIPNVVLTVSDVSDPVTLTDITCINLDLLQDDMITGSGAVFTNYGISGAHMAGVSGTYSRQEANHPSDPIFNSTTAMAAPRNALRRRNYKMLLDSNGLYSRSGKNMPAPYSSSAIEYSLSDTSSHGWLPLGYTPSEGVYTPIPNYLSPHAVYGICEDLNSSSTYFGVDVSDTFPARGRLQASMSGCHEFCLRDDLSDLHKFFKRFEFSSALAQAKVIINSLPFENTDISTVVSPVHQGEYIPALNGKVEWTPTSKEVADAWWVDHILASANDFISHFDDSEKYFESFKFGQKLHRLYRDYTRLFNKHTLQENLVLNNNIFSIINHIFGSILYNSRFDVQGSAVTTSAALYSSSLSSILFYSTSNIFSTSSKGINTFIASNSVDIIFDRNEFRNANIVSGVLMIMPSASPTINKFAVLNIDKKFSNDNKSNYHISNPLIYFKTVNTLARLKYDISSYGRTKVPTPIGETFINQNLLVPEHEFSFRTNVFGGKDDGTSIGGFGVGVWIHTGVEDNKVWTFLPNGVWRQDALSNINSTKLLGELAHKKYFDEEQIITNIETGTKCIDLYDIDVSGELVPFTIQELTKEKLKTFEVWFNTKNLFIACPDSYYSLFKQVHRPNQNYVFEFFMVPNQSNSEKYMLLDDVVLQDMTMYNMAVVPAVNFGTERRNMLNYTEYINHGDVLGRSLDYNIRKGGTNWVIRETVPTSATASGININFSSVVGTIGPFGEPSSQLFTLATGADINGYIRKSYGPGITDAYLDLRVPGVIQKVQTLSVYVKENTSPQFKINITERLGPNGQNLVGGQVDHGITFSWVNNVPKALTLHHMVSPDYYTVQPVNNGWFRCGITHYSTSALNYISQVFIRPTARSVAQDEGLGSYFAHPQLDYKSYMTGYQSVPGAYFKYEKEFFKDFDVYLTKEDILDIFRHFNKLAEQRASRVASITSPSSIGFDISGGSRLNYRLNPDWIGLRDLGIENNFSSITIDGV